METPPEICEYLEVIETIKIKLLYQRKNTLLSYQDEGGYEEHFTREAKI